MKNTSFRRIFAGILAALTLAGTAGALSLTAKESDAPVYAGTAITEHIGGYAHYDRTMVTHAYDFSVEKLGSYAIDSALAMGNRASADIVDGRLVVKDGMEFSFGSAVGLGDDYGIEDGYLSFEAQLTGGKLYLGLRTSMTDSKVTDRGIWLEFDGGDTLRIYEPECGLEATLPLEVSLSSPTKFLVTEKLGSISISAEKKRIAFITYDESGYLSFCDGEGRLVSDTSSCKLDPTGYFQLTLSDLDGWVDNVMFTNVEHTRKVEPTDELRLIDYSTWTATDAIDRTIADNAKAGDPVDNRYVGLFYFLCMTGAGLRVSDNTLDYITYGAEGIKARIEERAGEAYWAEPYFGYYRNTDTWVYRKHAYMLEAAGVDFIFLDVSNGVVFPEGHMALFDTWLRMRREGTDTPQIVFFNGDTTAFMDSNMRQLFTTVYSDESWDKYKELFFEWEGKPLVFGNMSGVAADMTSLINEKFTVRGCWAWQDKDNYWSWLQEYQGHKDRVRPTNGGWGRNAEGKLESLSVAMGHHPATSKGRSFVSGKQPNNGLGDFEFSSIEQAGLGLGFEYQFQSVQTLIEKKVPAEDPFIMMITGWNEWIAGGFTEASRKNFANTTCLVTYVDQFNPEFSRDGEPMRNYDGYGFGDNYYYQMTDYIRQYKGISETPVADHQGSINIYDLSSWDSIEMTYMDPLYDTEFRNTISYDAHYRYINNTGRNDLASAKVSQDGNAFYFLITAAHDIVIDNDPTWMNLFINTDGDVTTGWEGFDYVLNRARDSFVVTVDRFVNNTFETETVGAAYYYLEGDSMAIRLSKDLVGIEGKCDSLIFKWADNSVTNGDAMGFMDLGDTAPDNRFAYQYLCESYTTSEIPTTALAPSTYYTYRQNGDYAPKMDEDINITVDDTTVDVLYDMSDLPLGLNISDTVMGEQFEYRYGSNKSSARVKKGTDARGNYIAVTGYSDIRTWSDVEGSYEFSTDVHIETYGMSGIFIRGEMPGAYAPVNPKNHGIDQIFHYYEWDWYAENGGKTYGGSSTAGSGIGIYPGDTEITIRIKRYAEDGLGVASASYTLPYTDDFKPADDGWLNIRCVDDGETAAIYFNGALMCSIKLENPGMIYESDGTGQQYYGKATLCDAAGTEKLVVENTRLNSSGSQLAISSRNENMQFDNLYISYKTQSTEGSRIETVLSNNLPTVKYAPDRYYMARLSLGTDRVSPDSDTTESLPVETAPPAPAPEGPETAPVESVPTDTLPETEAPDDGGCRSILALPTLALLTVGGIAFLAQRKREE